MMFSEDRESSKLILWLLLQDNWEVVGNQKIRKIVDDDYDLDVLIELDEDGLVIKNREVILNPGPEMGDSVHGELIAYVIFRACKNYLYSQDVHYDDDSWLPVHRIACLLAICKDIMQSREDHCTLMINQNQNIQN